MFSISRFVHRSNPYPHNDYNFEEPYRLRWHYDEDDTHSLNQRSTRPRIQNRRTRPWQLPRKDLQYDDEEDDYYLDDSDNDDGERSEEDRINRKHIMRKSQQLRDSGASKLEEWMRKANGNGSSKVKANTHSEHEEQDDIWKEFETDENPRSFHKTSANISSSRITYDDIIRKLSNTNSDTIVTPMSVKRDYRNASQRHEAAPNHLEERWENKDKLRKFQDERNDDEADQSDSKTEYVDDENVEEEEIPVTASSAITRSSTSNVNSANSTATTEATTTTTTTSTTATTKRKTESMNNFSHQNGERAVQPSSQYNEYKLGKNDYPAMSSHSVLKWQHLGSRENLQRTRNNMSHFRSAFSKTPEALAARRHADRVAAEGSCQRPKSRVISVRDVYRDTSVSYKPHCVILYRCSHDTGCCNSESLTCSEKHSQQVEFYFQASYIDGSTAIKKLTFTNHTECECRDRKDARSRLGVDTTLQTFSYYPSTSSPQHTVKEAQDKQCACPTYFVSKLIDDRCECNCDSKNPSHESECLKLLKGKTFFSNSDRLCIHNGKCTMPNCYFGVYVTATGKCPAKKEGIEKVTAAATRRPIFYPPQRS
ncbi:uncharacterized protein LOC106659831 isoform X2 [Trichogramma pretiosum]|uniref:uncharacterized protein LOC106659831 isoform X2 n=1 Tax=Trichogramma pretiosum TaxID=7493 RepID=UPI000C71B80D|nr:uncharacterized protein LOC106659831 isoform X2 [Trichogramma pretiosum]